MKYIAIYILIVGCSSRVEPDNTLETDLSQCRYSSSDIESKHATLSAKRQGGALVNCFKNFIKFQTNKKQIVPVCHTLNITKNGKVTYSKINGINTRVSNDFKMCLEQSLWMMNFKSLQLSKNLFLKFPVSYESQ